ncbi:hypothetical protein [Bifidobacterium vespertilionis]|nr:hypothetical protein [Bifidobacterium vespertilionis]
MMDFLMALVSLVDDHPEMGTGAMVLAAVALTGYLLRHDNI